MEGNSLLALRPLSEWNSNRVHRGNPEDADAVVRAENKIVLATMARIVMFSVDHAANPCSIEADARRVISWLQGTQATVRSTGQTKIKVFSKQITMNFLSILLRKVL